MKSVFLNAFLGLTYLSIAVSSFAGVEGISAYVFYAIGALYAGLAVGALFGMLK